MSIDALIALIGGIFTAVAAVAAVVALVYARQTVEVAKTAREEADAAAKEAAADRRRAASQAAAERVEADYRYLIQRVEQVGEIVEDLFWRAYRDPLRFLVTITPDTPNPERDPTQGAWVADRNRLGVALVGVADLLPTCAEIPNAASPQAAYQMATDARQEVLRQLTEMHTELLTYQRAVRADMFPPSEE
jgi:hypothetical protein